MSGLSRPALALVPRHHPEGNLGAFGRAAALARPDATAVIDISGPAPLVLSYGALEDRLNQAVAYMAGLGIGRGSRVGMGLPNSTGFLVTQLALMRAGAVPVLINHRLPIDTIRFMVGDAEMTDIIVDLDDVPALQALADMPGVKGFYSTGTVPPGWSAWAPLSFPGRSAAVARMGFDEQCFQAYTAGSTGVPKGIVLTHGGMLWGIEHSQLYWPRHAGERGLVAAPMFHKNAMRGTIKPLMRVGGSFVIMRRFDPAGYAAALADHEVTFCGGVPAMFAEMMKLGLLRAEKLAKLETLSMGSSTVPEELVARLKQALPHVAIKESYGLTEGGGPLRAPLDGRHVPPGSVGVPAPEYELRLADAVRQADGTVGALEIRSPYVCREYWNRPDLTAERLKDGWLKTGDVFRVDAEGFYYFVGRADDMFVCGGENIYPKEVEAVLVKHPEVADAIVVPLPHDTKGFAPAAVVARRPGSGAEPAAIQDFCAANGPSFAIPRAVIVLDALPLTPANKPDRAAARRLLEQRFGTLRSRAEGRAAG
ncbi:MAG: class I adenylate-forming enzyme family protein [Thalassobaculales bacterium]